jgi:hypothetical protein
MTKYKSIKTTVDGITFASKREAHYYLLYKRLADLGTIKDLKLQPKFPFIYNGKKMFTYIADFSYVDGAGTHIIDVKSPVTAKNPVFRLKQKLIESYYNIKIEIVT